VHVGEEQKLLEEEMEQQPQADKRPGTTFAHSFIHSAASASASASASTASAFLLLLPSSA
jgi:hypothetical protein